MMPMPPAPASISSERLARLGSASAVADSPRPLSTSVSDPPLNPPRLRSHYDEPQYLQRYRGQRRLKPVVRSESQLTTGVDGETTPDRAAKRSRRELESACASPWLSERADCDRGGRTRACRVSQV